MGGTGYEGTHACVALLANKHEVFVVDNLSNSSSLALDRIKLITNRPIKFIEGDVRNQKLLLKLMKEFAPEAVLQD